MVPSSKDKVYTFAKQATFIAGIFFLLCYLPQHRCPYAACLANNFSSGGFVDEFYVERFR